MSILARRLPDISRVLLGLAFFVFGLNFFLHFLPEPGPPTGPEGVLVGALVSSKMLHVVKAIEVVAGLALLANRFVPLALTLLAPVLVAILIFHGVYAPGTLALPLILLATELHLAFAYRQAFAPMLQAKVRPSQRVAEEDHQAGRPIEQLG